MVGKALFLVLVFSLADGIRSKRTQSGEKVGLEYRTFLFNELFQSYESLRAKDIIPTGRDETLIVKFGVGLLNVDVDTERNVLTAQTWLRVLWQDQRLRWNAEDFGELDILRVPSKYLWIPDITLYNGLEPYHLQGNGMNSVVYNDSSVLLIPPTKLQVPFTMDGSVGQAELKFGSWTYDGFLLDLDFYEGVKEIDLSDYILSKDINILSTSAVKNTVYYPCCAEPYPSMTFTLKFQFI